MLLKRTAAFRAITLATALWATAAHSAPLTFTELFKPDEINDPKNAAALVMKDTWAKEIDEVSGRAYEFMYSSFKVDGQDYLVSMMVSPLCGANACTWAVQRISPSYVVQASGEKIDTCADRNTVDVTDGKLSICGKTVELP